MHNRLDLLQWLHIEMKCPWYVRKVAQAAAANANLAMLQWICSEPDGRIKQYDDVGKCAATSGSIEILQFLEDNRWLFDMFNELCTAAARHNNLAALQWLLQRGYAWNASTVNAAASRDHIDMVQYCCENGCPFDVSTLWDIACAERSRKCRSYIQANYSKLAVSADNNQSSTM
jgi:hypothetical protein